MSRRARSRRTPLPTGLGEITSTERSRWSASGPLIVGDVFDLRGRPVPAGEWGPYRVWPSWSAFFEFYETARSEWLERRRHMGEPITEALYEAWQAGERDIEGVRDDLVARRPDPRAALAGGRR